jgi:triacylglycerol lipase
MTAARYPAGFSAQDALNFATEFCQQAYNAYYIYFGIKQHDGNPYVFTVPQGYSMVYEVWGIDKIWHIDEGIVPFGFVAEKQGTKDLVFAIRGTEGDIEWAEDLFEADQVTSPIQNSQGMVHKGFASIYETLSYAPASSNSNTPPDKTVSLGQVLSNATSAAITGHSLGSSLATLLALDIAVNSTAAVSSIYTFASPRTGDPLFASFYDNRIPSQSYRVVNVWDLVPHLPPVEFFTIDHEWHYKHVNSRCPVDGGATIDVVTSHSLAAYEKGLKRLL